jgi:beta-mannosidase
MMKNSLKTSNVNTMNLSLQSWAFRQKDEQEWLPAQVPGCVHTDLLRNEKIDEPFVGTNELNLQWIDKKDWEYRTSFDVPESLLDSSHLQLTFKGLDTYATVYLNNEKILEADNMFREWKADVSSLVKKQANQLHIYFRSPINEDLPKLKRLGYGLPAANDHSEDGGLGDQRISVFARKAPYHYGWDWGPRFVTSGIWKDIYLEGWSECRVTDLFIRQNSVSSTLASVTGKVEVEADGEWEGTLQLSADGMIVEKTVQISNGINELDINMDICFPKLWWSRGLGDQYLYEFTAVLFKDGKIVAEKTVRTGLRSAKLITEKDDRGTSFYIELNGVPVFAKGANHIPNDSFVTEVTYERYKHEIVSAAESNMNMLRIWGGGIYEYDTFYQLCDEYGILVWQDFMFACSMYPGDEAFLFNVKMEAIDNIKRLRNHPSVVLWCGNNEIDSAWSHYNENAGWGWKQQYQPEIREKIWNDYEKVFHEILPEAVNQLSPDIDYWPSSPLTALTGDSSQHASSDSTCGDIHYWDVWHGLKPFEDYEHNIGRFMSEYGFQSFPELKTVLTFAEEKDLAIDTKVMLNHQKNNRGNQIINEYMEKYSPEPKDFPSFLYMSQILQAEGIKSAIEAHRRNKPYCMGTLYWQMNDCWPVASWASMDYYGRWKALHYYAKRSFQDVMISFVEKGETLEVYAVSDLLKVISGTLTLKLVDFNGKVLSQVSKPVYIQANFNLLVIELKMEELLKGHDPKNVVLLAELEENRNILDLKEHYFVTTRELELEKPEIDITEVEGSKGVEFILSTNVLAKQVQLSSETEGFFSDNYFDLVPGVSKRVSFVSRVDDYSIQSPKKLEVSSMVEYMKD